MFPFELESHSNGKGLELHIIIITFSYNVCLISGDLMCCFMEQVWHTHTQWLTPVRDKVNINTVKISKKGLNCNSLQLFTKVEVNTGDCIFAEIQNSKLNIDFYSLPSVS